MKNFLTILFLTCILTIGKTQNINQLRELYSKGYFEKALEISTELVQKETQNSAYNQIHGRILADLRKFKEAIPFLLKAIEIDSSKTDISGWAYGYLGQCYFMLEKYENAETSLSKCIQLNATPNSMNYGKKRLFLFGFDKYFAQWEIIETKNIRFHIQFPDKISDIKTYISDKEKAFIDIQNYLGTSLPKKIDYFVWDNKSEPMEKFKIRLGFADSPNVSVYSSKDQSVGHEMTHVISYYISNNPIKTGLINEGLAVYLNMEKDNKQKNLERIIENKSLKNLKVLDFWLNWKNYPEEISYPFAGAFMEILIEKYGIEKLKPLLINQTYENAKVLFGADLDSLISSFEEKLK